MKGEKVMSFSDWLIVGGAALLIKNEIKKDAADREETEEAYNHYLEELQTREAEWDRRRSINAKRCSMPCFFNDGLTYEMFEKMAKRAGKKIKRIKDVSVWGGIVCCNVESQTGYSDWNFSIDFNDWGHVTGTYWTKTDNIDSSIPSHYGKMVSGWIHDFYREKGIFLPDLSEYVDENKDLEINKGLIYVYKEKILEKIFGNKGSLVVNYGINSVIGEHLYPVISILKKTGFKNIKIFSAKDINDFNPGYSYQVENIAINGIENFVMGMTFPKNSEVCITYREKQAIRMPFSQGELKRENYISVGYRLQDQGFTQIYARKIEDLVTGWIKKEGSVDKVLLDGDENRPIKKNAIYDYDQRIVICYHSKKCK